MIKLVDLPVGRKATLAKFEISALHRRLLSMGISPGQVIEVVRKVPFNGSLYIRIEGRNLAVRHAEADQIYAAL